MYSAHKVQPALVRSSDNDTWAWRAGMRGNSRTTDGNGIKWTKVKRGSSSDDDQRTNSSRRHTHLVYDIRS
jgi:hypothetical protein